MRQRGMHNEKNIEAGERTQYPIYTIRPFYGMQPNGQRAVDPTGYDVYEQTGPQTEAVISPCDTMEEAKREMERIKNLA